MPRRTGRDGKPLRRSTLRRYLLLQLPGLTLGAAALWLLVQGSLISSELGLGLFALWIAKDLALYPVLRVGYEDSNPDISEQLVGALGSARSELDPEGWVRVGAELWRARCRPEDAPVAADTTVRVMFVRGLLLEVEALRPRRE